MRAAATVSTAAMPTAAMPTATAASIGRWKTQRAEEAQREERRGETAS
jgi:hypothetical protein